MPPPMTVNNKILSNACYGNNMTYMNQSMKRTRATPNAASMKIKVTPPATAPELLPGASGKFKQSAYHRKLVEINMIITYRLVVQ
jgi:hypothetical protein